MTCPPEGQDLCWVYAILAGLFAFILGGVLADRAARRPPPG